MIALKNELAKIVESYWDKPYDSTTMKSMEDDIKVHINTHIHDINNSVCVKDNLIYITESFFKKNGGILPFIPYAFSVKEDFFYDLHIGYVHNQQIAFKKVFDINNYGYEITVRDIIKDDKETDVVVEEVNNDGVISLLPHNQKLFNKIMKLVNKGERSIFYFEATGLGKSYVFMALVNKLYKNKKVLYIVPKVIIWDGINEYKEFLYINKYVQMATYADFNYIKNRHYEYDAIFIDECHHLTSPIQGSNIRNIMKTYVDNGKRVYGFTATPEVIYNRKCFNVDTYFNAKAYGMDYVEAVRRGIFKKIQYAIADPDTIIDDKDFCKKYSIDGTKTLLENILDEHKNIDKWLVYFSNIDALNNNLESLKKLFPDFKLFHIHSKNSDAINTEQIKAFNAYSGKCLMLNVSMALEGVHLKNVKGILLYRNVTVYRTLEQILGRVCEMYSQISPVCVDIANSISKIPKSYIELCANCDETSNVKKEYTSYERRIKEIIDITASTYKYIDLLTNLRRIVYKYKGYVWVNNSDLSKQLGCTKTYIGELLRDGKYNSCEEIIDAKLNGTLFKRLRSGGVYKNYIWKNKADLSRQLGHGATYVRVLLSKGKYNSCEEIIDAKLNGTLEDRLFKPMNVFKGSYKGYVWKNYADLSRQLGRSNTYINNLFKSGKYNSCEEIIDAKLNGTLPKLIAYSGSYKNYTWKSYQDLSKQLGYECTFVGRLLNRGKYNSCEEIIDAKLNGKFKESVDNSGSYKGYVWKNYADLSKQLRRNNNYVSKLLRGKKYNSCEEIIDAKLNGEL